MASKSNMRLSMALIFAMCAVVAHCFAAHPFTTVPWNGHSGAVSFTFDDAMEDQIVYLTPILQEMPDVRVTFFLSNMGADILYRNGAGFAALAQMGNEVANHTNSHRHLPNLDEKSIRADVIDFANEIERVMSFYGVEANVTSHALPFSSNNDIVSNIVNERHFINRSCGGPGRHDWNIEPRWTNMESKAWYTLPNADKELLKALDTAAYIGNYKSPNPWYTPVKGPSWLVLLNHGVSYAGENSITPELIRDAFERAVNNNLWVAPFSTVGAYYRAHFAMDKAIAVNEGDSYKVSWKLSHSQMPKSIPLKVTLNDDFIAGIIGKDDVDYLDLKTAALKGFEIEQNGKTIQPDSNGVFTIEFTELSLTIRKAGSRNVEGRPTTKIQNQQSQTLKGEYAIYDLKGNFIGLTQNSQIPANLSRGNYILRNKYGKQILRSAF